VTPEGLRVAAADNRLREPLDAVLDRAPPSWRALVQSWRHSASGRQLASFIGQRQRAGATIYPARVLHALELTCVESVQVVVLGQDPYHALGQAEGLAFSVPDGATPPPSLRNILAELGRDLGTKHRRSGHLGGWARQGVLLLNSCLSVEEGQPGSHFNQGWEALTTRLIHSLSEDSRPKVFMLWGAQAQAQAKAVDFLGRGRHLILMANHPSPLSARRPPRPFLGCGHFGLANRFLAARGEPMQAIDWLA
jgi:uracil-DNA glycosylase